MTCRTLVAIQWHTIGTDMYCMLTRRTLQSYLFCIIVLVTDKRPNGHGYDLRHCFRECEECFYPIPLLSRVRYVFRIEGRHLSVTMHSDWLNLFRHHDILSYLFHANSRYISMGRFPIFSFTSTSYGRSFLRFSDISMRRNPNFYYRRKRDASVRDATLCVTYFDF